MERRKRHIPIALRLAVALMMLLAGAAALPALHGADAAGPARAIVHSP
ncbi:hypothetical protein GCM10011321_30670 [Youhaiella tibetensis]|nr:hypothetical protein [Youhaiella tibetensis]GGF37578.1 hypothetical protein GCM10011321_30670 [Youhaiella tibetensis]